jgi:hypothetical protein
VSEAAGGFGRNLLHVRTHPRHHPARLQPHALDLHIVAAPYEIVAAQRTDEQHWQEQIARQSVERLAPQYLDWPV